MAVSLRIVCVVGLPAVSVDDTLASPTVVVAAVAVLWWLMLA